jgi:hypothetical protein
MIMDDSADDRKLCGLLLQSHRENHSGDLGELQIVELPGALEAVGNAGSTGAVFRVTFPLAGGAA